MDVRSLTDAWESLEAALALESFKQYAALGASEERMEALAGEVESLAQKGLAALPRATLPPLLWQGMVAAASAREMTRLQNDIYRLRNEVKVDVAGESVHLNNVRSFNAKRPRDARVRREAFEGLMGAAPVLTPTLRKRFGLSAATWAAHGMTPLDAYLVEEGVTRERLTRVVDDAARAAKPAFLQAASEFSEEILGKPFEAFDDMYVFRSTIYGPVDPAFAKLDFRDAFLRLGRSLGIDAASIHIDGEPREGKFSSPVCFGVRIPGDVRVLYQRTTPIGDYESFYHEMGHAVHFAHVGEGRAFHERRLIPMGVAELFSTLFEEVSMDPVYLKEDLGIAPDAVDDLLRRRRFMELFFLTFYGANSMHKLRFWTERMWEDFPRADEAYADLTERYMGVRVPGIYWQTHHVMGMSDVYAPSYLLANIRKSELIRHMQTRFGRAWWRDEAAGAFLKRECMEPGASIDLPSFSRLDADAYVRPIVDGRA